MGSSGLSRPVSDIMIGIQDGSFFTSFNWFYVLDFLIAKLLKSAMNSFKLSRSVENIKIGIQDSSFFVSFNRFYLSGFLIAKL